MASEEFLQEQSLLVQQKPKIADGSYEAYKIFQLVIPKLLEDMRSAAAEDMKQTGHRMSDGGAVSSCLELERCLKSKRKRPFGSPGRK
jgi:hypothetical protein